VGLKYVKFIECLCMKHVTRFYPKACTYRHMAGLLCTPSWMRWQPIQNWYQATTWSYHVAKHGPFGRVLEVRWWTRMRVWLWYGLGEMKCYPWEKWSQTSLVVGTKHYYMMCHNYVYGDGWGSDTSLLFSLFFLAQIKKSIARK
jgi:hypothetical protein